LVQIPRVSVVDDVGLPPSWPRSPHQAQRVLILDLEQSALLVENKSAGEQVKVLLLAEQLHSKNIAMSGDLPCDGIMSLADLTISALDKVLHQVVSGEMPMPAPLAKQLLSASRTRISRAAGRPVSLTARENETLGLLAQGYSNKQIARALGISAHGVKRLVGAVLMKLGAPNRTTAVITAMNEGLV